MVLEARSPKSGCQQGLALPEGSRGGPPLPSPGPDGRWAFPVLFGSQTRHSNPCLGHPVSFSVCVFTSTCPSSSKELNCAVLLHLNLSTPIGQVHRNGDQSMDISWGTQVHPLQSSSSKCSFSRLCLFLFTVWCLQVVAFYFFPEFIVIISRGLVLQELLGYT